MTIKIVVITIFHTLKKPEERSNLLSRDVKDIKSDSGKGPRW